MMKGRTGGKRAEGKITPIRPEQEQPQDSNGPFLSTMDAKE